MSVAEDVLNRGLEEARLRHQAACEEFALTGNDKSLKSAKTALDEANSRLDAFRLAAKSRQEAEEAERRGKRKEAWAADKERLREVLDRHQAAAAKVSELIPEIVREYEKVQATRTEAVRLLIPWGLQQVLSDQLGDRHAHKIAACLNCAGGGTVFGGPFREVMKLGGDKYGEWDYVQFSLDDYVKERIGKIYGMYCFTTEEVP